MDSMLGSARRDNAVFRARQAAALAQVPNPTGRCGPRVKLEA